MRIGLLNSAVPAEHLDEEVRRYTDMLALGGPIALAATKDMLCAQRPESMQEDLAQMLELSGRHFTSEEGKEGMAAFLEKRKASWVP